MGRKGKEWEGEGTTSSKSLTMHTTQVQVYYEYLSSVGEGGESSWAVLDGSLNRSIDPTRVDLSALVCPGGIDSNFLPCCHQFSFVDSNGSFPLFLIRSAQSRPERRRAEKKPTRILQSTPHIHTPTPHLQHAHTQVPLYTVDPTLFYRVARVACCRLLVVSISVIPSVHSSMDWDRDFLQRKKERRVTNDEEEGEGKEEKEGKTRQTD